MKIQVVCPKCQQRTNISSKNLCETCQRRIILPYLLSNRDAIVSWTATALALLGNLYIVNQNATGFWVWLISNTIWIFLALKRKDKAQATLFFIFNIFSIIGIINWNRM